MGQPRKHIVLTLKISDKHLERLLKKDPALIHLQSKKENRPVLVKELKHSTVLYSAAWQEPVLKQLESPMDFLKYYYLEQFEFHIGPVEQKRLMYNLYFMVPAKANVISKFLKWFRNFVYERKIPLEKDGEFRATFNSCEILSYKELKKLHCWKINDSNRYAVIYSIEQHKQNVLKWKEINQQKELQMRKAKELKEKKAQEDWDAETEEVMNKKKSKTSDEKRSRMKEKLAPKKREKKDEGSVSKSEKKGRKVRKNAGENKAAKKEKKVKAEKVVDPIETAVKNLKSYLKENLGEGVVTVSEKDVAKAFKDEFPKGMMKGLVKGLEDKYNVQSEKTDDGVVLTIWKKAKKVAAKVFKG